MFNEHQARAWPPRRNRAGGSGAARAPHLGRPGAMVRVGLGCCGGVALSWMAEHGPGRHAQRDAAKPRAVGCRPAVRVVAPPVPSTKGQVTTSLCGAALVAVLSPSGVMSAPGLGKSPLGPDYSTASFVEGAGLPSLREALASGAQAEEAWQQLGTTFAGCRAATFVYKGTKVVATGDPWPLRGWVVARPPMDGPSGWPAPKPVPTSTSSCSRPLTTTGTFPTSTWGPRRSPP